MTVIALRGPVDMSYRRMIAGMELFEKRHNLALLDRTYFVPLGDPSWPDDALVEFEYMDGGS